jgi:hypothetical protein
MYNIDEIKARLDKGETLDDIAAEMTATLNAAQAARDAEIAQQKKDELNAAKRKDMECLVDDILAWLENYYPALCDEVAKDLTESDKDELFTIIVDAIIEAMDKTAEAALNPRKNLFGMNPLMLAMMGDMPMLNPDGVLYKSKAPTNKKSKSDDDILNEFLGKICH